LGRSVVAALVVLSCVLVSASAMVPTAKPQASPAPSAIPTCPDPSKDPVTGTLDFSPSVLNLGSAGRYVTVRLALPDGVSPSSVYIPSVRLMGTVYAETCFSDHETGADKENSPHLVLKFVRDDVEATLSPGASVPVFVTGMLVDGTPLVATGVIAVTSGA